MRIKRNNYRATVLYLCSCLLQGSGRRSEPRQARRVFGEAAGTIDGNAQECSSSQRSIAMHKKQNRFVCCQMATIKERHKGGERLCSAGTQKQMIVYSKDATVVFL